MPVITAIIMQPHIDVEILAEPFCILNGEREFNIWFKYKLHHQESITVDVAGSVLDPAAAFTKGRFEVIDAGTENKFNLAIRRTH